MIFENIIGQQTAVTYLKSIISQNRLRSSYLFLGPKGVGKRTTSIEFAKAVNCEYSLEKERCSCSSCRKIDSMNHPDVFVIRAESASGSIKIEKVRDIIYQASLTPYEAKKRVFIIVNAESMTEEAQNALLKLLEEVPKSHSFVLTSSNISGVLPTVLSRCKVLRFKKLSQSQIQEFLQNRNFDEKAAVLFSHLCLGSIGRAIAFKEKDLIARRDQLVNDFFLRKSALLKEDVLIQHLGEDIEENLCILLCWYRDILVANFTEEPHKLLNIDRSKEIFSYRDRFSKERLEMYLLNIIETIGYVRRNVNPKIAVFNMAVALGGN